LNGGGSQAARRQPVQPDPPLHRPGGAGTGPWPRLLARGLGLGIALLLLLGGGAPQDGAALAWTLPGRGGASAAPSRERPAAVASRRTGTALQEVAAPIAVQQLAEALAQRQPRLTIVEPADGASLPEGPWTLRLQVEDWPLVDAGSLGLGPHLLVQLDDGPAMPLVETSLAMPPLSPGSHRLTVMAARPWGEVVKRPGAFQQIRLQRIAANPLSQPAPGSPQLLATAPLGTSPAEPVLLDWLLIDAPLQNLRADDARWRLRVSVNADSFLVDQATPLWLKGWRPGSNALLLELVDGRGDPLNPPFNSLVREVRLLGQGEQPAWLNGRLSDADLARLLGEAPPEDPPAPVLRPQQPPEAAAATSALEMDRTAMAKGTAADLPSEEVATAPTPADEPGLEPVADAKPTTTQAADEEESAPEPPTAREPTQSVVQGDGEAEAEPLKPASPQAFPPMGNTADLALSAKPAPGMDDPAPASAAPAPASAAGTAPSPRPSAREEVRPDGTLIRPARTGVLQALRERLRR